MLLFPFRSSSGLQPAVIHAELVRLQPRESPAVTTTDNQLHFPVNPAATAVIASQSSVRNGAAGNPAPFTRFAVSG
jgi:hypothetical protein